MSTGSESAGGISGIESRSFDFVPEEERHGAPRQVFYMWFGINAQVFGLVTGFIGIAMGLNFWYSLLAIVIGISVGTLFMAFHAAQGPQLGLPQMIQSRAQFGYYGALLPLVVAWVMYIVYLAIDIVLAGQGFQAVWAWSLNGWMILLTIPMVLLGIYGYDFINRYNKYETWLFLAVFFGLTVFMIVHGVPGGWGTGLSKGTFAWGPFVLVTSIIAAYVITYAPYVSDYTRYLPKSAIKSCFWETYAGTVISCVWLFALGALIGVVNPNMVSMLAEILKITGPVGGLLVILLALGLIAPNSTNVYGGMMTALTIANNVVDRVKSTRLVRTGVCIAVGVLGLLVATVGAGAFMTNLENYLTVILYIVIPWSVINLTDFYILRHGQYRTEDFYDKSGPFGKVNMKAMIVYVVSFGIEFPFMNTTVFEGPVAKAMGGGDIAWIVGAVASLVLYLGVMRVGRRSRAETAAGEVPEASAIA